MNPVNIYVVINTQSGTHQPNQAMQAIETQWGNPDTNITYQISRSITDGQQKIRTAIQTKPDLILIIGGDGTLNSLAKELLHSSIPVGIIPTGSGNGFARHFNIPLQPQKAAQALRHGEIISIDAGLVNDHPFFITCSLAWEARLTEAFEQYPFRGLAPYLLAGAQQLIEYQPHPITFTTPTETSTIQSPLIFTIANLSQFGNGFYVAPEAKADSGTLELVAIERHHLPILLTHLPQFIDKTFHKNPYVLHRHFQSIQIERNNAAPLQIDGELLHTTQNIEIKVAPAALQILIPQRT